MSSSPDAPPPWVLVCGGFHSNGAMDRMNLALAEHLLSRGRDVYLVGHEIDATIRSRRGVHAHAVPRLGAVAAGELLLDRTGRRVAKRVRAAARHARVIVNGGNCMEPDVNWVHAVHHAWSSGDRAAPAVRRATETIQRRWFRRRERRAVGAARVIVANSARTRSDLIEYLRVSPDRLHVVRPGADPAWRPPTSDEQCGARVRLGLTDPTVLFVGALGSDDNKGFGPLLAAWRTLCSDARWTGTLLVAGHGPLLPHWTRITQESGLSARVKFLDFVPDMRMVFAASDLMVSASRYESYGLAIAEALCRGVPAIVPESAGIAPELGPECAGLIVRGPADGIRLADAIRRWAAEPARWRAAAAQTGARLRQYTLDDMGDAIVTLAEA